MEEPKCSNCGEGIGYQCKENEVVVLSEKLKPMGGNRRFKTLNFGDLYKCNNCGGMTVTGFGDNVSGEFIVKEQEV